MGLKLKRYEVDRKLISALEEVGGVPMEAALSYNVSRLKRKLGLVLKENQESLSKRLFEVVEKDEHGVPQVEADELGNILNYKFISPEAEKEFHEFEEKFLSEELEIESYAITLDSLSGGKISPNSLESLSPVLFVHTESDS